MPDGTPIKSREELLRIKYDYQTNNYKSISELARRYGMKEGTLSARIRHEKWSEEKEAWLNKASQSIAETVVSEAEEWVQMVKARAKKDWKVIDKSIDELVGLQEDAQGNIIMINGADPGAMKAYSQARKLLDDMARRCLGLADAPQSVDLKSGGVSIGQSIVDAIQRLRNDPERQQLTENDKNKIREKIREAEIIEDVGTS